MSNVTLSPTTTEFAPVAVNVSAVVVTPLLAIPVTLVPLIFKEKVNVPDSMSVRIASMS